MGLNLVCFLFGGGGALSGFVVTHVSHKMGSLSTDGMKDVQDIQGTDCGSILE